MELAQNHEEAVASRAFALLLFVASVAPVSAYAATDQPRMVSYGDYVSGSSIKCTGTICDEILKYFNGPDMWDPNPVAGTTGGLIDHGLFCRNLELGKPANCDAANPPSSPGIDPNWIGNGCGDGTRKIVLADAVLDLAMANYSGSLDNPLPSISFFGACQTHDQCYGMAPSKAWCDSNFQENLYSACSLGTTTYLSQCQALADTYTTAVELGGMDAHNEAQDDRACAAWAKDMEQNECNG